MKIELQNLSAARIPRARLSGFVQTGGRLLARELKTPLLKRDMLLMVVFVDSRQGRALNKQFRGRDYATDVLSFAPIEPTSLGELVLCPAVLKRQAREAGWSTTEEMALMCLHGLLHLLGFDHERGPSEARRMFDLQERIFARAWAASSLPRGN